jgi:type I restriction enzyme S subunit
MDANKLITEHIDLWTSSIKAKATQGRGSSKKHELYGINRLRELILSLGMRGKLVPQIPSELSAQTLIEKIKANGISAHQKNETTNIRRSLETSAEEKPFHLPSGWAWVRFGEIFDMQYGNNLPDPKRSGTGEYPVYGSNGVVGSHNQYSVAEPCIIIGRKGSAGALNLSLNEGCWVTDVAYSLVPPTGLDLHFTYDLLHTLNLDRLGKGIKPGLNRNDANALLLAIPPLEEQLRIVSKINELMALCDNIEERTEASITSHQLLADTLMGGLTAARDASELADCWAYISAHFDIICCTEYAVDRLEKTILELGVMGRLVPQDPRAEPASKLLERVETEKDKLFAEKKISKPSAQVNISDEDKPFPLPNGWEWCRLSTLSLYSESGWSPKCHGFARENNAWGVLKVSAVTWGKFNPRENKQLPDNLKPKLHLEVAANDFLISRANTAELVARSVVVPIGSETKLMMSDKIIRFIFSEFVSPEYLSLVNNSQWSRNYYAQVAGGTSNSMKNVSRKQIGMLVVALPPMEEQIRIFEKITDLFAICEDLRLRINHGQITQLHLTDALVSQVACDQTKSMNETGTGNATMKITTILSLGIEEIDSTAVIAPLLRDAGGSANAKDIWGLTRMSLPEFYAQLKKEIESKFITKPASAEVKGINTAQL